MKNVCIQIIKTTNEVYSIGIKDESGKYYVDDSGGWLNLNYNTDLFFYKELNWKEFKQIINNYLLKEQHQ